MRTKSQYAYKLFRVRKDGSIGSLFINPTQRHPIGKWMKAQSWLTPGFAFREGWHSMKEPKAPHLTLKGRQWFLVEMQGKIESKDRPASQGKTWFVSEYLKIIRPLNKTELKETINYKSNESRRKNRKLLGV